MALGRIWNGLPMREMRQPETACVDEMFVNPVVPSDPLPVLISVIGQKLFTPLRSWKNIHINPVFVTDVFGRPVSGIRSRKHHNETISAFDVNSFTAPVRRKILVSQNFVNH